MLYGGDSGTAVVKGNANTSELWLRIASDEMPEGEDREKLSAKEKQIIRTWIDRGMPTLSALQKKVDPLLSADKKHSPKDVASTIESSHRFFF